MRILMLTEYFPPLVDSEAIVAGKLAKALSEQGVEMEVVAGDFSGSGRVVSDSAAWGRGLGSVTRLRSGGDDKYRNYPAKLLLLNEAANAWALAACRAGRRLIREKDFDLMISRTWTVMAMIAASRLQRPSLPWLAVINDPYPESLVPVAGRQSAIGRVRQARRLRFTRKTLARASAVAFPADRLRRYMERGLGLELAAKSIILPHIGWKASIRRPLGPDPRVLNLLHCGYLSIARNSESWLEAFHQTFAERPDLKSRVRIHQIGPIRDVELAAKIKAHGLEENFSFRPTVGYEESLEYMAGADALLLVESVMEEGIFLPSKFADYAGSGRPLLMFSPEDGGIADLVGGFGHPGFLGQRPPKAAPRLAAFLDAWSRGRALDDYRFPDPGRFSPAAVASGFLAAVHDRWPGMRS